MKQRGSVMQNMLITQKQERYDSDEDYHNPNMFTHKPEQHSHKDIAQQSAAFNPMQNGMICFVVCQLYFNVSCFNCI